MYLHLAKLSVYAKNTDFLLPVFKGLTKYWCQKKAPISHIFNTTNEFLTSGMWGCPYLRTEGLLTGNFMVLWGPVGRDGLSCSSLGHGPRTRQIFFWDTCYIPIPQRGEGSLWSVGLWEQGCVVTELAGTTTEPLPSTKRWAGSSSVPFSGISTEKGLSYRGFLTQLS